MGADGHIRLMDVEKLIVDKGLSEERFKQFFLTIKDSLTYIQTLNNQRYVSVYWGDNLFVTSRLSNFIENGFVPDGWEAWDLETLNDRMLRYAFTREEFDELAKFLWNECYVTEWEVWT